MVGGASCPVAPAARVRIYQVERGFDLWVWLCLVCLGKRLRHGYVVKANRTPAFPDLPCADCEESNAAEG